MCREVNYREYTAQDYEQFNHRIHDQVDILKSLLTGLNFSLVIHVSVLSSNYT